MSESEESRFIRNTSCEKCGSSDAKAEYSNGTSYCFSCSTWTGSNGGATPTAPKVRTGSLAAYDNMDCVPLEARGINQETATKFGVRVGKLNGKIVQAFPYFRNGELIAFKAKDRDKNFSIAGEGQKLPFFGQHLWPTRGKKLIVTEGELDALSMSQVQGNKWPVVSVPNGAAAAAKVFRQNLEWLDGWDEVIIMFDMDKPGREAADACAEILRPGQAKIAELPMKDANEMLMAGKTKELMSAMWDAKEYRPDGIVSGKDLWSLVAKEDVTATVDYPFSGMNTKTRGLRQGELVTITSGSGVGKSALVRELAYHIMQQGETVGMIMLEENPRRTALGLMGLYLNKPVHISREGVTQPELREAYEKVVGTDRLYLYDHFGSTEVENMLNKVRYMSKGLGCKWIFLDHLSILVSGLEGGDERRMIDNAMTMLRTLVEETGIGLILVSHLKRPSGDTGHEEGAATSLSQLRGSHAIAQLSDIVIGLERNQQGEEPNVTTVRILKNRHTGDTGTCGKIFYDHNTGRLSEHAFVPETMGF